MSKKIKKKTKRKLSKRKILIFIVIIIIVSLTIKILNTNITNIYIKGNRYLSDQEIIDLSGLNNYPKSIKNMSFIIKERLKKSNYINNVEVSKNIFLNKVYINVKENYPLFYYYVENKTVLYNGDTVEGEESSLIVTNKINKNIYDEFIKKLQNINITILNRISEIKYEPNDVMKDRFLLVMNDGNYVYITLNKFLNLNKYLEIIKSFNDKNGILYLDSGEYFDMFD